MFATIQQVGRGVTTHAADIYKPNRNLEKQLNGALIATSTRHNLEVMRTLGYPKVRLIPNGVPTRSNRRKARTEGRFHVVSVGRLISKKGHADLVRAIGLLRSRQINATCEIVGSGPDEIKLTLLIAELGLDGIVTLVGSKSHKETFDYYDGADVFALASRVDSSGDADGLPVALLDAASSGIPIVATQVSGLAEFVGDDVAWSAQPNSPISLSEALEQVAADPAEASKRAARAQARVRAAYGIEKQSGLFEELAEESHA
jgi:glycosyltransferase involved in cell wall biosynthesis